ncbi:MAG: hypothetical protein ABS41_00795 [Arenimonas sp. SCN 70-307]|uniref:NnrU family protein n=1 Tax=Arenimonas sp. SCN 70-307 TaxID=1660089 RepID=UPI00086E4533|nr:NnrU family protein [Arenimonas sp. SCN 70-307]ODS64973.1 MAG: hypothetical protein ABS41_00795 [Arenimonas sp. SCN 70-307]
MSHAWLVLGLLVFLGGHSLRIFAPAWRDARVASMGEVPFKVVYSLVSIAGFVLLVWGYAQARSGEPVLLWVPPLGLRHAVSLLTLPAFILLVAAYVPGNHFKARLGHPMLLAVKLWALAHLLVNGWLHGVLLFGGFLLWAILGFRAARRRAPAPGGGRWLPTLVSVVLGAVLWAGFVFHLHKLLIGVAPFG